MLTNLQAKEAVVARLRKQFEASPLVVLTEFRGAKVKEFDKLRRSLEKSNIKVEVVKNSLCERALAGTDKEILSQHFRGNVLVMFSTPDAIETAKALKAELKDSKAFSVKTGFFEGALIDAAGIDQVAALPSREELLGMLLATVLAGPQNVLGVLQAPGRDLMNLLSNFASKLEKAETNG